MEQQAIADIVPFALMFDRDEGNPQDNMDGIPNRNPGRGMVQGPLTEKIMICPSSGHNPNVHYAGLSLQNLLKGNYVGCWGGDTWGNSTAFGGGAPASGVFNLVKVTKWPYLGRLGIGKGTTIVGITDGTSNTAMLSELLPYSEPLNPANTDGPEGFNNDIRGAVIMPAAGGNLFVTNTPPNSATQDVLVSCEARIPPNHPNKLNCTQNQTTGATWAAARSKHTDGSVKFVRDSIDPTVWKAAGTKSGGEVVTID